MPHHGSVFSRTVACDLASRIHVPKAVSASEGHSISRRSAAVSRARAKIVAEHAFKFFYYMLTLFCAVATDVRGVIRLAMPKAAAQPFT